MEISPTDMATQSMEFNPSPQVNYNPPPAEEGIAPTRDEIVAESESSLADPAGRNLDTYA